MRVIAENFAAKLPPSPQLTVLEHQSSSSRSKNIKSSSKPTNQDKQTRPYSERKFWKKNEHFSDADIQ
jgi:hypothetical protein